MKLSHFLLEMYIQESLKLVGYGVDTLILNVCYADKQDQPIKQELDEQLAAALDCLQNVARSAKTKYESFPLSSKTHL